MKIKKGDQVKIITGNDKGKQGKVIFVSRDLEKIAVEGVQLKKKHIRPRAQGKKGEMVRIPGSFPVARAMLVCPQCGKATRVGSRLSGSKKSRVCKKCNAEIS